MKKIAAIAVALLWSVAILVTFYAMIGQEGIRENHLGVVAVMSIPIMITVFFSKEFGSDEE